MTPRPILVLLATWLGCIVWCASAKANPMPLEPWLQLAEQAKAAQKQGYMGEAERLLQLSLKEAEKLGPEHPAVAVCLHNLAWLYTGQSKLTEAEALLQKAVVILTKNWGPDNPRVAFAQVSVADLRTEQKRFIDAEPLYQSAVAALEKTGGPESALVGLALEHYAYFLNKAERPKDAELIMARARVIRSNAKPRSP